MKAPSTSMLNHLTKRNQEWSDGPLTACKFTTQLADYTSVEYSRYFLALLGEWPTRPGRNFEILRESPDSSAALPMQA
jgi:hypothetical protein